MSVFDRIDRAHREPARVTAPRPEAGHECADPKCRGRFVLQQQTGPDPDRPPAAVLTCSGCGTEVWL